MQASILPLVSIVVHCLDNQHLHYRILTIKLANQKGTTMATIGRVWNLERSQPEDELALSKEFELSYQKHGDHGI